MSWYIRNCVTLQKAKIIVYGSKLTKNRVNISNWVYENKFNIVDRGSVPLTVFFSSKGVNFPKKISLKQCI